MKLTDIKGVTAGLPRTPEGARAALLRYEQQNQDLDQQTRRILGLAAIGRYFGRTAMEHALGPLPTFPFRDWSWRWWNVLYHSGLASHWDTFVKDVALGGLRKAAHRLRGSLSPAQYLLFLRRAGTNPHNHRRPSRVVTWTKGGTWDARSNFTQILILRRHLPGRPMVKFWQRKLGDAGVRLIENELMHLYDPDVQAPYEIKLQAVQYVRRRIAEMLNRRRPMSLEASAWFFQQTIYDAKRDAVLVPVNGGRLVLERVMGHIELSKRWDW